MSGVTPTPRATDPGRDPAGAQTSLGAVRERLRVSSLILFIVLVDFKVIQLKSNGYT